MRKPGEPIYLRRHMVGLAIALGLPLVLLQLYKVFIGPISLGLQLVVGGVIGIAAGLTLYLTYRSSAQNHP
jgi:hypothetical protein